MREAIAIYAKLYFDADADDSLSAQTAQAEAELWSLATGMNGGAYGFTWSAVIGSASEAKDRDAGGRPPLSRRGFRRFEVARCGEWRGLHTSLIGWNWPKPEADPRGPDAAFWTVYGFGSDDKAQAVGDFKTRGRALAMAEALADGRAVTCRDSMLPPFMVTFETVTDESAEIGDAAQRGFMIPLRHAFGGEITGAEPVELDRAPRYQPAERWGFPLRDALAALANPMRPDGSPHGGSLLAIEPSDSVASAADWLTVYYDRDPETGAYLSLSIHFPETVSGASRVRILRLLNS